VVDPGDDTGPASAWEGAGDVLRGPGRPGLVDRLERWVADARVDEAALQRSRARWLRDVADQEATLAGTLLDLGERRAVVTVRTAGGRVHRGAVEAVGVDFIGLRLDRGATLLLAVRSLASIRTTAAEPATSGERAVRTDLRLGDLLRELAADREDVLVVTVDGGEAVVGQLRAVGEDVVTLRVGGDPPWTAYLALAAIGEVTLG